MFRVNTHTAAALAYQVSRAPLRILNQKRLTLSALAHPAPAHVGLQPWSRGWRLRQCLLEAGEFSLELLVVLGVNLFLFFFLLVRAFEHLELKEVVHEVGYELFLLLTLALLLLILAPLTLFVLFWEVVLHGRDLKVLREALFLAAYQGVQGLQLQLLSQREPAEAVAHRFVELLISVDFVGRLNLFILQVDVFVKPDQEVIELCNQVV